MAARRVYCLAEDRGLDEVGLRLAVLSLVRACPAARVVVYRAKASADFCRWVARFPGVRPVTELPAGAFSWNCKPHTLLPLLEEGADEAIWLDADILVTRDPSYLFASLGPEDLLGAEEPAGPTPSGWAVRTRAWGMELGRESPVTLNTCVLRVTRAHEPLLRRWRALLAEPTYVAAQHLPGGERPFHLISDQDVLNALLGSQEFEGTSVKYLGIGRDVIHCGGAVGYSLAHRLDGVFRRVPPFLHSIGGKPWYVFHPAYESAHSRWFTFYRRLLQETSPYVAEAKRLRAEVELPCPWMDRWSPLGLGLRAAGFGHYALRGMPLTVVATTAAAAGKLLHGSPRPPATGPVPSREEARPV
jgi:hypothetical protein